jgi:DNA-binding SARP family transcriptional activator/tetratricopeptide (TPR) repeat protein
VSDVGLDRLETPQLRVRLVGHFEISAGSGRRLQLPVGKATLLARLLAVRRRSFVPIDAIIDVLWGERPPARAAANVASLVSRLRRTLGSTRISGGRAGYRFQTAGCWVDVDEAERLVTEAESQLRDGRAALAATAAVQARHLLEHGTFLADEPYAPWTEDARRQAERLLRRARHAAWTAALALGEPVAALEPATLAAESDPVDEEAHRACMQALYLAGDPSGALATSESLRATLARELGTDPAPETEKLYLSILRSEPVPAAGAAMAAATLPSASPSLVGRDLELGRLLERWSEAVRGEAGIQLVSGSIGSGKTRLAAELAAAARATGAVVLWATCHEAERSLFLQPLLEALGACLGSVEPQKVQRLAGQWAGTLAELMPELPVLGGHDYQRATPELEQRRSLTAISTVIEGLSREQPVLIALDDLHHAGRSTLEAVCLLPERLAGKPILIVGTVASDEVDEVLALVGHAADVLPLRPLSPAAVEQLRQHLGAQGVDALELHERTGGHAQFVVEALRLAAAGHADLQPQSLRTAVLERVGRAGKDVEELLRGAAVVGGGFELDFVADLMGLASEDAVQRADHALRAGLLIADGPRFLFAGSIIRDVLYETTPAPIRTSRHRRAAAKLADRPEMAAAHHAAAGDWPQAHAAWSAAAEHAIRSFALRDGERLLTHAISAAEQAGDDLAGARARIRRGQLREELADYKGANEDHTAALAIARTAGDEGLEAQALERLGWTAYYGRDSAVASELAARAAELAESAAAAPAALPSALVLVGRIRHWAGDIDGAARAYEEALSRDPDEATVASALSCLGALLEHGDRFAEARHTLDLAAAESTRTGAFRPLLRTLFFAALARANLGDFAGALRALNRKRRLLEEYDVHFYRARTDTLLSWVWREVGQPGRARDMAERAVAEARDVSAGTLQIEQELHGILARAECALLAGDEGAAGDLVAEAGPLLSNWLPFRWRAELRYLELRCRLVPGEGEHLLDLARQRRSRKYEALALAHLGRHEEAAAVATATGSDLLVAEVAPPGQAQEAFDRLAGSLPGELRDSFVTRGRLAGRLAVRR